MHHGGCERSFGQGPPLFDDFSDVSSSRTLDDLEVDQTASPQPAGFSQGREPIPHDILAGAGEH